MKDDVDVVETSERCLGSQGRGAKAAKATG